MNSRNVVILKPGREKALLRRHPWVFSGAVAGVEGNLGVGETVEVLGSDGEFLAHGAYSPQSQIRVRVWTWDSAEEIDQEFFRTRLNQSISTREDWRLLIGDRMVDESVTRQPSSIRLIHAESDGLPGLIVDRYADTLVMQVLSAGVERWREIIADLLLEITGDMRVYERSDLDVRKLEGLSLRIGTMRGIESPGRIQIEENGLKFWVDISKGHKTGFYLDQRLNRARVKALAVDREVLDCFSYSGGFALNALAGSAASVTAIESSEAALTLAEENRQLNDLPQDQIEWIVGDVFQVLRKFRDSRRDFDMIILDPPKFAPTASQAQKAARGYKDINLLAFKLLRPGGMLVTFSCSGGISAEFFQKIVAGAALDAGVSAQIVEYLGQSPDHPIALNFPEGAYLKGLIIRIA